MALFDQWASRARGNPLPRGSYVVDCYERKLESVSDILDIVQRPSVFLEGIIDDIPDEENRDPLGRSDSQYPRPFPYGIWFRGQKDAKWLLQPAAFRTTASKGGDLYYDEKNLFHDLRLRTTDYNSADFSNFDIMCMMRHHTLPTRVLDWSENILVAAFFAVRDIFQSDFNDINPNTNLPTSTGSDPCIIVINTYRLNEITNIVKHVVEDYHPGMLMPDDLDVIMRATCADHTYIEDVLTNIIAHRKEMRLEYVEGQLFAKISEYLDNHEFPNDLIERIAQPVGVMPKRANPRMDAQLSTFTIHGGKRNYSQFSGKEAVPLKLKRDKTDLKFLPSPISLDEVNDKAGSRPFLKKFVISRLAIKRIMIELDRIGISEPMLFPEMDNQAEFVTRRWSVITEERAILNLPALNHHLEDEKRRDTLQEDAEKDLYGKKF